MKDNILCIAAGLTLLAAGTFGIYYCESPWYSALLFLGSILLCLPSGVASHSWRDEIHDVSPAAHKLIPHESLFVARLFIGLSYIARNQGILALEDAFNDKSYVNTVYKAGKNMIIEGYDPDYTRDCLNNMVTHLNECILSRIRYMKQLALSFVFVGIASGLAGTVPFTMRYFSGAAIPATGVLVLLFGTVCSLILGLLCYILIPNKIYRDGKSIQKVQRQVIKGLLSLQQGDSYNAIMRNQYTFLSAEEVEMFKESPVPLEFKEEKSTVNYNEALRAVRKDMRYFGI
jgi:flagellar motor component MotA